MTRISPTGSRPPFFYGWVVIVIAFVTIAISVNARTTFSLLFPPILDEFGWSRGATAATFSVGFLASAAFTPLVGVLMDRFGPRFVIPVSAFVVAAGFMAATWIDTPVGLYLTLGLFVTGGSIAMSFIGHSMFLPNWFVRRRGLAVGIAFSGVGAGAIILLPGAQYLIDTYDWRTACIVIAVIVAVPLIPLNMFFQRRRPADLGLSPDGDPAPAEKGAPTGGPNQIVDKAWAETDWTLKKAMRTTRFWWIFLGYFCALFAWYAIQVHQTKYLFELGFGKKEAAFALGLVALFAIPGQIAIGYLSDRVGREVAWTVALCGFVMCYGILIAMASAPSPLLLYLMVGVQGLLGYGVAALYGVIPSDIYGGPRFATIFSVTSLGGNIGAGTGPWLMGVLYDLDGDYISSFWLTMALSLASIVFIWLASPRKVRLVPGMAARRSKT